MKKTKPKTPICPRCFNKISEKDERCRKCGFYLISDSDILHVEDFKEKGLDQITDRKVSRSVII